jgi:hypothetical protein
MWRSPGDRSGRTKIPVLLNHEGCKVTDFDITQVEPNAVAEFGMDEQISLARNCQ